MSWCVEEDWALDRVFILFGANKLAMRFTGTMKDYPPSQTLGSFNLDSVEKRVEEMSRMEN